MRYAGIIDNDIVDGDDGLTVSFWCQGCDVRCKGCHNPQTWDFHGGQELPDDYLKILENKISKNGIVRNLSILGGEPLCKQNRHLVSKIASFIRGRFSDIKITIWTGHIYEDLLKENDNDLNTIFNNINVLVDGPYKEELRDINLKLRGSSNQRIIKLR